MSVVALQRLGRRLEAWKIPVLPSMVRRAMLLLYTAYLPTSTEIGEGTVFGYHGIGTFTHPQARIGKRCLISHFVTIGGRSGIEGGAQIGNYVRIGIGAKILGPVKIGDFAVIGANAVVVKDVPPGTVVGGVPARHIKNLSDPVSEYEQATGLKVDPQDRGSGSAPAIEVLTLDAGERGSSVSQCQSTQRVPDASHGGNVVVCTGEPEWEQSGPLDPSYQLLPSNPASASPGTDDEFFA